MIGTDLPKGETLSGSQFYGLVGGGGGGGGAVAWQSFFSKGRSKGVQLSSFLIARHLGGLDKSQNELNNTSTSILCFNSTVQWCVPKSPDKPCTADVLTVVNSILLKSIF